MCARCHTSIQLRPRRLTPPPDPAARRRRMTPSNAMPAAQVWDGHAYKDRNEDLPLVLPRHCLRAPGHNRLSLSHYDVQPHVLVVGAYETCEPEALMANVQRQHTMMPSAATAHMRRTFGLGCDGDGTGDGDPDDDDDDVIAGPARLSLACPLSHKRIAIPARGATCRHLECFDLGAYIECAQSTSHPRWSCPLCAAPARPDQLRVDPWTSHVLESSPVTRLEVEVNPDGSFGPVPTPDATSGGSSSRKRKERSGGGGARAASSSGGVDIGDDGASSIYGSGVDRAVASGVGGGAGGGGASGGGWASGDGGASGGVASDGGGGFVGDGAGDHAGSGGDGRHLPQVPLPFGMAGAPSPPADPVYLEMDEGDDVDHPICLDDDDD